MTTQLTIKYLSHQLTFNLPSDGLVSDLVSSIESELKITIPPLAKLIVKGKLLAYQDPITKIPSKSTVIVIATSEISLKNIETKDEKHRTMVQNYNSSLIAPKALPKNIEVYFCDEIKSLSTFVDYRKADLLLHRVRTDIGVAFIMKKYKWKVTLLLELHPIDDASILGFNRNKGEVIALRLRTDDLCGFRTFDSIRRVMLHELAHMYHFHLITGISPITMQTFMI